MNLRQGSMLPKSNGISSLQLCLKLLIVFFIFLCLLVTVLKRLRKAIQKSHKGGQKLTCFWFLTRLRWRMHAQNRTGSHHWKFGGLTVQMTQAGLRAGVSGFGVWGRHCKALGTGWACHFIPLFQFFSLCYGIFWVKVVVGKRAWAHLVNSKHKIIRVRSIWELAPCLIISLAQINS